MASARFNHIRLTDERLAALRELAKAPNGSTAIPGVLSGGHLATLVSMGLAERMPADPLGGCRYRVTTVGRSVAEGPR